MKCYFHKFKIVPQLYSNFKNLQFSDCHFYSEQEKYLIHTFLEIVFKFRTAGSMLLFENEEEV